MTALQDHYDDRATEQAAQAAIAAADSAAAHAHNCRIDAADALEQNKPDIALVFATLAQSLDTEALRHLIAATHLEQRKPEAPTAAPRTKSRAYGEDIDLTDLGSFHVD